MFAKKILLIATLCCFIVSLSACTGKKESSNTDVSKATDTGSNTELSPQLNSERVKIHFEVLYNEQGGMKPFDKPDMEAAVAGFNRLHPDIEVIIDYISIQNETTEDKIKRLETDQSPDIVPLNLMEIKAVGGKGLLRDLQSLQSEEWDIPLHILEFCKVDGELQMLPVAGYPSAVYYNKVLFDQANVPYPAGDWTWDQFRDISRQMKDHPSLLPYSLFTLEMLLASTGNGVLSPDGSIAIGYLDSPASVEMIQWLNAWYREQNRSKPMSFSEPSDQFGSLKSAMLVDQEMGSGGLKLWYPKLDENQIGVAPLPYFAGGQRVNPQVAFQGYAISRRSKHPEEAWQFIHYLTLEKNEHSLQLAKDYLPTSKAMAEASGVGRDPFRTVFYEELNYAGQFFSGNNPLFYKLWWVNQNMQDRFAQLLTAGDDEIPHKLHEIAVKVDAEMNGLKHESEKQTQTSS